MRWKRIRQNNCCSENYRKFGRTLGDFVVDGLFLQSEYSHQLNIPLISSNGWRISREQYLDEDKHHRAERNEYNFDHPDAFDIDLMVDVLRKLKEGRKVEVPIYNFVTHSREPHTKTMYGANVIIFEGILVFHSPEVLKMLDMKVFVDTDADIRLARRLKR